MSADVRAARDRSWALRWNGWSIALSSIYVVFAFYGSRIILGRGKYYAMTGLALLLIARVLLLRGRAWSSAALMVLGGVLTFPPGMLSFCAARRAFRMAARGGARVVTGVCSKCGYDLRGTPLRCPECGCLRGFVKNTAELGIEESELRDATREDRPI